MKKQILFLAIFTLAVFLAGTTKLFAQAPPAKPYQVVPDNAPTCLIPKPLSNCTTVDALHPVQGVLYTYTVTTTNATDDVRWFVVNNDDLVAPDSLISALGGVLPSTNTNIDPGTGAGDYILNLGTNNTYNANPVDGDGTGTNKSIDIAWKYFDGMQPNEVLLVAYVEGDDGCTNNIAVYRIIPEPAFTIDIAVLNDNGDSIAAPGTTVAEECVSPIESAVYASANNTTPNGNLTVDYGENWVFFIVNGANYIDSWLPEFVISYTGGTAPAMTAQWAYRADANNAAATWNTIDVATGLTTVPVIAGGTANSVGGGAVPAAGGECIVVRVRMDWGTTIEHDQANGVLTFAANGIAYDGVGTAQADFYSDRTNFEDLHHADCAIDGFTNDRVTYNITPRPQVEAGTPVQETKTGNTVN